MAAASATIKAIDASAVHKIQSGQVIVNLCSVVKELVENGIDAGATSIEVRFKNQGLDAIEVQDNGSGIAPANYASLALKHYTSKLSTYDDLDTLQTFGFRGEALSSLCALSKFTVTTCVADDVPRGAKLEFETSGGLQGTSVVAAQRGTTVAVENLFWNLPVRRRELERNVKREWAKVISLLNQYACVLTGVKLNVSQQPSKGKRVVLFSTKGNAATRDNIINVFGAKTMGALIALDLTLELEMTRDARLRLASSAGDDAGGGGGATQEIHVRGFVSRPAHGQGRQTPDRQMFYVNGRPCKLPQFAQLFGEVYRTYNASQSPFIFADIQLDTHLYDVNVSPDKQTILLHDQGKMLDNLRESLIELFEKQDITVPLAQLTTQKTSTFKNRSLSRASSTPSADVGSRASTAQRTDSPQTEAAREGSTAAQPSSAAQDTSAPPQEEERAEMPTDAAIDPPEEDEQPAEQPAAADAAEQPEEETRPSDPDPMPPSSPLKEDASPSLRINVTLLSGARKRPSREVATITVGDETVSTSIITSSKRQKTGSAARPMSTEAKLRKTKPKAALPSFGSKLTQMFAAAGARRSQESSEPTDEEVENEVEDDIDDEVDDEIEEEENGEDDEDEDDVEEDDDGHDENVEGEKDTGAPMEGVLETHTISQPERDEGPEEQELERGSPEEEDDDRDVSEHEEDDEEGEDVAEEAGPDKPGLTDEEDRRSRVFLKSGGSKKRHETLKLVQTLRANEASIEKQALAWKKRRHAHRGHRPGHDDAGAGTSGIDAADAEEKLSLTIAKSDFAQMRVVGQFNLGFILAVREGGGGDGGSGSGSGESGQDDELFIIDQHASDEKYNFERLQASTVVQSQRLVQAKRLELTAVEEEVVLEHQAALAANGFVVQATVDGSEPVGARCRLETLPLSRETTFGLADLEELIALLGDSAGSSAIPRPSKVRRMFAMRACRSSIMIGKALTRRQMQGVLAHMGEMDKPWNCPHGRPTMRHLCSLGQAWDAQGWEEGGGGGGSASWDRFLKKKRRQ